MVNISSYTALEKDAKDLNSSIIVNTTETASLRGVTSTQAIHIDMSQVFMNLNNIHQWTVPQLSIMIIYNSSC